MCCEIESGYARSRHFQGLGRVGETEEAVDKRNRTGDLAFSPTTSPDLYGSLHCLDTLNRSPRRVKCSEALHRSDAALYRPVILFDDVVLAAAPDDIDNADRVHRTALIPTWPLGRTGSGPR